MCWCIFFLCYCSLFILCRGESGSVTGVWIPCLLLPRCKCGVKLSQGTFAVQWCVMTSKRNQAALPRWVNNAGKLDIAILNGGLYRRTFTGQVGALRLEEAFVGMFTLFRCTDPEYWHAFLRRPGCCVESLAIRLWMPIVLRWCRNVQRQLWITLRKCPDVCLWYLHNPSFPNWKFVPWPPIWGESLCQKLMVSLFFFLKTK